MKELKIFLLLIILSGCINDQERNSALEEALSLEDTISLSRSEYERLRKSLLEDTAFTKLFFSNVPSDDKELLKIKKLLETPYDYRDKETGYSSKQVDSIFYALKISKEIKDKFTSLDRSLDSMNKFLNNGNADSFRDLTLKHIQHMNKITEELNQNK